MKTLNKEKGITLIALVITIIILLILAAITLNLTIGENGIFYKAQYAKEQYENAQKTEQQELNKLYSELLIATNDNSQITVNIEDLNSIIQAQVDDKTKELQTEMEEIKSQMAAININKYIDPSRKIKSLSLNTTYQVEEDCIFIGMINTKSGGWFVLSVDGYDISSCGQNGAGNIGISFPSIYLKKGSTIRIHSSEPSLQFDYNLCLYGVK